MFRRCILLLLFLLPGQALANPVNLLGFGARGQGLANAMGASAQGFEALFYNPAALAFDTRPSFAVGYQFGSFDLQYGIGDGPLQASPARDIPGLSMGFAVPLPFGGALQDRLAIGLGFVIPQTSIFIADIKRPGEPSFVLLENRAQAVSIQAALSARITDDLSIGFGTLALAALRGHLNVAPNEDGYISSEMKDELIADYAWTAGINWRLFHRLEGPHDYHALKLGLTFRGESIARFDLPITADLGDGFLIPIPEITISGIGSYDPMNVALEASYRPWAPLSLHGSLTWEAWSQFPIPLAYAAVPEGTPPQPEPNFHDIFSFRFGLEGHIPTGPVSLSPRLGFTYAPSPAPAQTGFHNHLDSDRFIIGAGFGIRWGQLRLDLAAQLHEYPMRTSTKGPAMEDNPGFPSIRHQGRLFFGAVELGVEL